MSITLVSTTDTPEQLRAALESSGQAVDSVDVETNEAPNEDKPAEEEPAATEEDTNQPESTDEPLGDEEPAEGDEDESDEESGPSEDSQERDEQGRSKKGPGKGFHKRLKKLESHISERDERIGQLTRELEQLKAGVKPRTEEEPVVEQAPAPRAKPTADDTDEQGNPKYEGSWDPQFIEDLSDWKAEQREAKLLEKIEELRGQDQAAVEAEERNAEWGERVIAAKERYSDWDEVSKNAGEIQLAPAMASAIFEAEGNDGTDVLYYLASHPEDAQAVYEATFHDEKADPATIIRANRKVGREFSRILDIARKAEPKPGVKAAAQPATTPVKPKPKTSKAPAPINPVRPSTGSGKHFDPHDPKQARNMTHKQFMEWRAKQKAA